MEISSEDGSVELLDTVIDSGIVTSRDETEYRLTEQFESHFERYRDELDTIPSEDIRTVVEGRLPEAAQTSVLLDLAEVAPAVVAEYLAIVELDERSLTHSDRLAVISVLDSFRLDGPPADGAPMAFLPISGTRLPLVANIYEKAVVYVWLDDCDPCETVRRDLDEIFGDVCEDLALFAVYGPAHQELLADQYDVRGGPAVLFFYEGLVDARLYGAQYQDVFETEIEKHRAL
ncbi:thioredoxin family protein [Halobellus captivus]|uniref:thioredoxin family protein n=1 Tax=Halobellus captivus TaxID=2592614 RepID=UPI0011A0B8D5|nr:thioredoxin family protein [Halobellus captivus]